jgi:hypothetical protein
MSDGAPDESTRLVQAWAAAWPRNTHGREAMALIVAAAVVAGAGSWAYGLWPSVATAQGSAACFADAEQAHVVDLAVVTNDRPTALHVDSVTPHRSSGVRVESTWFARVDGELGGGALPSLPGRWLDAFAEPLPDGGIDVARGESVMLLAVVGRDDRPATAAAAATADGFDVRYRVALWPHTALTGHDLTLSAPGGKCG